MKEKFNTLLFGNGLTIALFSEINKVQKVQTFEDFFVDFLYLEEHKRLKRDFYKILLSKKRTSVFYITMQEIAKVEKFLIDKCESINKNGYEVEIGNYAFIINESLLKDVTLYYNSLFNYWYNLNEGLFNNEKVNSVINKFVQKIKNENFDKLYTTNYDKYFDEYLDVKHIHGKFVDEYSDVQQMHVRYHTKINERDGLPRYVMCIGTNGFEKGNGLLSIKETGYGGYEYSFLFDKDINLGHLLIYGMRFADSLIIPEEIRKNYSNNNIDMMEYVDGHIMERLDALYEQNKLKKITMTYYSDTDKERYIRVFAKKKIKEIIEYVDCRNIFN